MRLLTAAGVVVFAAGTAFGAYIVDLDGGDRMTVDSYWEEGGRVHLMCGGVDLNLPKSRVRTLTAISDDEDDCTRGIGQRLPAAVPSDAQGSPADDQPADRQVLEARQRRIDKHLIKLQRERFEAPERGASSKELRRIERELSRTQRRRSEVMRALGD
jgi:hypothetical protein